MASTSSKTPARTAAGAGGVAEGVVGVGEAAAVAKAAKTARAAKSARTAAAGAAGAAGAAATANGDSAGVAARPVSQGPSPDTLGQRLRSAREQQNTSLRALAKKIEVSPSFLSQVELGRATPSVGTLYALVTALGLSLNDVMSEEDGVAGSAEGSVAPAGSAGEAGASAPVWGAAGRPGGSGVAGGSAMSGASAASAAEFEHPHSHAPAVLSRGAVDPLLRLMPGELVQRAEGRRTIKMSGVTWERLTPDDDPLVDFLYVSYTPGSASCPDDDMMRHGGREYGHVISGHIEIQVGFETYRLGPGDSIHFDSTTPHRLSNPFSELCVAVWVVVGRRGDPAGGHGPTLLEP